MRRPTAIIAMAAAATLIIAACSGSNEDPSSAATSTPATTASESPTTEQVTTTIEPSAEVDAATLKAVTEAIATSPAGCDLLDTRQCLLPFPSDAFTVADTATESGLRVSLPADGMPQNADGVPVDPSAWSRNDGFSPNAAILTYVENLDVDASSLPAWTDLAGSLDDDASVVLVDTASGERVPLWAEPDAKATAAADRLLVVRPAIGLEPGTTYAVGLQGLMTNDAELVTAAPTFEVFRDQLATDIPEIEDRRDEMESVFTALDKAGVARSDLQLAWSFTTATTDNVTGRIIQMRDDATAALDGSAPEFAITSVDESDEDGIGRLVEGTFTVPNWMTGDGSPGNGMNYDDAGEPLVNGTVQSPFACMIPDAVIQGDEPARVVQYGHGLLGSHLEIDALNIVSMGNEHNAIYCATKWAGMSEDDVGNAVASLQDLSNFSTLADRLQQGVLNQIVLGRLMLAEDGIIAQPEFTRSDGSPLVDNSALYFDGNSQGAIMGMMLAAVSQDFERAVLGVVGSNYSLLLPRSVDFDQYEELFVPAYENDLERELLLSVIQMLWDSGEGAGYMNNIVADPLPDTPPKDILMHVAFGDWQVTELSAMVAARTIGIPIHRPVVADGRSRETDPGWGIETLDYETDNSALIIWDSGSDPIPIEQRPPRTSRDPHDDPRYDVEVRRQKAAFLFDGVLIDVCRGQPCTSSKR